MAEKKKVNKTKAVPDYLKTHAGATGPEIAAAMAKQGIKMTPTHAATTKSRIMKRRADRKAAIVKPAVAGPQAPKAETPPAPPTEAVAAKPTNAVTLEQIKMVGQMVRTIGGFRRLHEMLGIIKEVGGLKKFKDLLDAMAVEEATQ